MTMYIVVFIHPE